MKNLARRIRFLSAILALWAPCAFSGELLRRHTSKPFQAEADLAALEPWETPISGFFVRAHHAVPVNDHEAEERWVLVIDGLVEHPLHLTLADLKRLPQVSVHAVLECSGNGRALQNPKAPGVQWERGAVGNAAWGGVALADLLRKAGVKPDAHFGRVEGADKPSLPEVPGFVRSVPIAKLLQGDSLLVLTMNREALPTLHGGPLRLALPNWYGENWTKWLTHITLTESEDSGFYMAKGYRVPKQPIAPGTPWDPSTGAPIEQIKVQSIITAPRQGERIALGADHKAIVHLRGKTFSGASAIEKVEYSLDGGQSWHLTRLDARHADGGWQDFSATLPINGLGSYTILSRATDGQGETQPMTHAWNPGGYARNAVDAVRFSVAQEAISEPHTLLKEKCLKCHGPELIVSQRLSKSQWDGVLKKMVSFGAALSPAESAALLAELSEYGPERAPAEAVDVDYGLASWAYSASRDQSKQEGDAQKQTDRANLDAAKTFQNQCASCHGTYGEGKIGPRLSGRAIDEREFLTIVRNGRRQMPSFAGILKESEPRALWSYLRSSPETKLSK